jgi:hypothetical protein
MSPIRPRYVPSMTHVSVVTMGSTLASISSRVAGVQFGPW